MSDPMSRSVLVTGCSSGIGRALAREFARRGHRVFATARHPEALADLAAAGLSTLALDVTRNASIAAAVAAVLERAGRIDVLVNNAGFGLIGPVVELPLDRLRAQLETNVVGALAVAQAVAPAMIDRRSGVMVNVGSVSGILTTPFAGAYCASKAALHALTDALRLELAPFGIDVVSLQPGGVVSHFGEAATRLLDEVARADSRFAGVSASIRRRASEGQRGAMDTSAFARRVVDLVCRRHPPRIIRLGRHSIRLPLLHWLLPAALTDRSLARRYGLSRLRPSPK
jgi:NAD(P)-dependent dehydrogenase (short-subunit alcohol dehydrogenase family)